MQATNPESTAINIVLSSTSNHNHRSTASNVPPCVYRQSKHQSTGAAGWRVLSFKSTSQESSTKYIHICYAETFVTLVASLFCPVEVVPAYQTSESETCLEYFPQALLFSYTHEIGHE